MSVHIFFRAYEISKGVLNTKIENHMSITEIPKAFEDITSKSGKYCNETHYDEIIDFFGNGNKKKVKI